MGRPAIFLDTSLFHPSSRRLRRLFFPRLFDFPPSVQRRARVAFNGPRPRDVPLAVEPGDLGVRFLPGVHGGLQFAQRAEEAVAVPRQPLDLVAEPVDLALGGRALRDEHVARGLRQRGDHDLAHHARLRQFGRTSMTLSADLPFSFGPPRSESMASILPCKLATSPARTVRRSSSISSFRLAITSASTSSCASENGDAGSDRVVVSGTPLSPSADLRTTFSSLGRCAT